MTRLQGTRLDPLAHDACQELVGAVAAGDRPAHAAGRWLLAHTDHGAVWGHRPDPAGPWRLAGDAFPGEVPALDPATVQQLRLFGPDGELLVWRDEGWLRGRRLTDASGSGPDDPARPFDEPRVLLADRLLAGPRDGFSMVGDAAGSRQVVPLACQPGWFRGGRWPLRLVLRHYLEADQGTGVIRVAATRLVELTSEER